MARLAKLSAPSCLLWLLLVLWEVSAEEFGSIFVQTSGERQQTRGGVELSILFT